ncbi:hypothetical protein LINPERHAP1_LOCUS25473 [Linum perenne]
MPHSPSPAPSPAKKPIVLALKAESSSPRTNGKEMRETAHSSPSPAKKPPTPFPKGRREEESENLSKSAKHFMSPTVSTASRKKIPADRKQSSPILDEFKEELDKDGGGSLILDESSPIPSDCVPAKPQFLRHRAKSTSTRVSDDSETQKKKLGRRSSVCFRVIEFLLLLTILALSIAFATLKYCPYYNHHEVEIQDYQVAYLTRIKINGTSEPAGAPMEDISQAEEPMAAEQVSELTPADPPKGNRITTTVQKGECSKDLCPKPSAAELAEPPILKGNRITSTVQKRDRSKDLGPKASVRKPRIRMLVHEFDYYEHRKTLSSFCAVLISCFGIVMLSLCFVLRRRKRRTD